MRLFSAVLIGIVLLVQTEAALAQPGFSSPVYFAVDGVAADDVLNVRAAPDSTSEIVGSLAPNAAPVEVLNTQGGWAKVSSGEGTGWASLSFLRQITLANIGDSSLPEGLSCSGTEPFWGLGISSAGVNFSGMDMAETRFDLITAQGFAGFGPSKNFIVGEGGGQSLTAVISDEICSDGMSDREYARRIDMVMLGGEGPVGHSGCCSMPLN